jgi:hypothetical protein
MKGQRVFVSIGSTSRIALLMHDGRCPAETAFVLVDGRLTSDRVDGSSAYVWQDRAISRLVRCSISCAAKTCLIAKTPNSMTLQSATKFSLPTTSGIGVGARRHAG